MMLPEPTRDREMCMMSWGFPRLRQWLFRLFLGVGASLCTTQAFAQSSEKMRFWGEPPGGPSAIFGTAWTIYADGPIDEQADARLRQFIESNNIPSAGSTLALNSPGGSLTGGMKLGRAIRELGLWTYVGRDPLALDRMMLPGKCYSSCSLAYIGGEFRFMVEGSIFGVHRFYFTSPSDRDADTAQVLSSMVLEYIRDMEVDPSLFSKMAQTDASDINVISAADLRRFNIVNDGIKKTVWSIESLDAGLYLKGERQTSRGVNKFMLLCIPGEGMGLYVIFDPEGRGDDVVTMPARSLFLDGKLVPLSKSPLPEVKLVNGWINLRYHLDYALLQAISGAKTVGIALQFAYDAPTFAGFDGMEFGEGAKKLPGLLTLCQHR
ncbi:MAG TPA: hypothetical protein PKA13_19680 [Geminicoccaceae bacterium]|nr:hypothetical protein [Geminicoccus sp.]HMU52007.1 hypothetical protein [Geminicoccaceae bacterium]